VRRLLRPLLVALLKRRPDTVDRAARSFAIAEPRSRELVRRLGQAFLDGFNAMLEARELGDVARRGRDVEVHWRPFFFEGAAMGYLPRSLYSADAARARAERDLLALDPAFRYLYYVGFGFWYGFRHPRRPERLEELGAGVEPFHRPLCWDGWGFKRGFFDPALDASLPGDVARCAAGVRAQVWQGFGRAGFFRTMDAPERFVELARRAPAEHRHDLEQGRSLAVAFTGIDRPEGIVEHVRGAATEDELAARLTGVTWALTARRMNDAPYFESCLARAEPRARTLLAALPELCEAARADARDYADWQERTRRAVVERYRNVVRSLLADSR
jgi:hypothetical protein